MQILLIEKTHKVKHWLLNEAVSPVHSMQSECCIDTKFHDTYFYQLWLTSEIT